MGEITDSQETITITLTLPPVTCAGATPHYSSGCALLRAYDTAWDGVIDMDELFAAIDDVDAEIITPEEYEFVDDAYRIGSINAKCPGCYIPPTPAKGLLQNISYPASATQGTAISIECKVYNSGESAGTFKVALYTGTTYITATSSWQQSAKTTTGIRMISTIVPNTGVSVSYTLKCIRVT